MIARRGLNIAVLCFAALQVFIPVQAHDNLKYFKRQPEKLCLEKVDFSMDVAEFYDCVPKCLGLSKQARCLAFSYDPQTEVCSVSSETELVNCTNSGINTYTTEEVVTTTSTSTSTSTTSTTTTTPVPTTTTEPATTTTTKAPTTTNEPFPVYKIRSVRADQSSPFTGTSADVYDGVYDTIAVCFSDTLPFMLVQLDSTMTLQELRIWGGDNYKQELADIRIDTGTRTTAADEYLTLMGEASNNPLILTKTQSSRIRFVKIRKLVTGTDLCVAEIRVFGY